MNDVKKLPTWRDVGMPLGLINSIKEASSTGLIAFLVDDRVYHKENKICYIYRCSDCGHRKSIMRQYEDYASCEKCTSSYVHGSPYWKENRIGSTMSLDPLDIITNMTKNYYQYLCEYNDNSFNICWENGKFYAFFLSGEKVGDYHPSSTIAKAAILCPFLWDATFNWQDSIRNDRDRHLHITHLIKQWGSV